MLVFLSWSGERSKAVAEELRNWLPLVINAVEPWMSADMEKGTRWGTEVAEALEKTRVGIFCLTPENLTEPWLLFEAGAICKTKDARACTLLLGLRESDVDKPLGQLQHTRIDKEDVRKLLDTINNALRAANEKALDGKVLDTAFKTYWPTLEKTLTEIGQRKAPAARKKREPEEVMEEVLATVRGIELRLGRMEAAAAEEVRWTRTAPAYVVNPSSGTVIGSGMLSAGQAVLAAEASSGVTAPINQIPPPPTAPKVRGGR